MKNILIALLVLSAYACRTRTVVHEIPCQKVISIDTTYYQIKQVRYIQEDIKCLMEEGDTATIRIREQLK